ncbi:MAG: hypothetical protein LRS47_03455 [Desulfurococcales archaeon]|nr:hypothetical protein [Desulfurococcales archaeon]
MYKEAQRKLYNIISTLRRIQIKTRLHISRIEKKLDSKRLSREERAILLNTVRTLYKLDFIIEWIIIRSETMLVSSIFNKDDVRMLKEVISIVHGFSGEIEPDISASMLEISNMMSNLELSLGSMSINELERIQQETSEPPLRVRDEVNGILNTASEYADNKIKGLIEKIYEG